MPVTVATALTNSTVEPIRLSLNFTMARTICLVVDFFCSAPLVRPTCVHVQEIVYCRIVGLIANIRMALNESQKSNG